MTLRRSMTLGFAVVLVALCGCQPDETAGPWTTDGGIDSEDAPLTDLPGSEDVDDGGREAPTGPWSGEWTSMPPTRGGHVFAQADGEILVSSDWPRGELTAVSSNGESWREPGSSPIASRIVPGREVYYTEADGQRYLLGPTEQTTKQLFEAPAGSDDWQKLDGFSGVESPQSLMSVNDRLIATGHRGIHARHEDGSWAEITRDGGPHFSPDVWVGDTSLFTRQNGVYFVSADRGQTWSGAEGLDDVRQGLDSVVSFQGRLFALGEAVNWIDEDFEDTEQFLMSSAAGLQWDVVPLNHDRLVNPRTLTVFQDKLYATDAGGRLIRVSTDGSIEPVTGVPPELFTHHLYAAGSRLVTTFGLGAVATWKPGETRWRIAPVENGATLFDVKDGRLWARTGVIQSIGEGNWRWEREWSLRSSDIWATSNQWIVRSGVSDCLYLHSGSDWEPSLQWSNDGIKPDCSTEDFGGRMTDIVVYRDGYAVSRISELLTTGGGPTDPEHFGEGGLIYWNPDTDKVEHLVPDGLEESDVPGVRGVANVDGTLWAQTASDRGIPGTDGTLYRVEDRNWTEIEPDVLTVDGTRFEEQTRVRTKRLRGYGGELVAEVQFSGADRADPRTRLARWSTQSQAFEVLPAPAASVQKRSFTDLGPAVVTSKTLRRYDIQQGEWQQIGRALPTAGENIANVTAEPGAFYLNAEDGSVWVTRPTKGNE